MMSFDAVRSAFDNINPFHARHQGKNEQNSNLGLCQRDEGFEPAKVSHKRIPAFSNPNDGSMLRRYSSSYSSAATTAEHTSRPSSAFSSPMSNPVSAANEGAAVRRTASTSCPSCEARLDANTTMCEICGETIVPAGWAQHKRARTSSTLHIPASSPSRPPLASPPMYHPVPFNKEDAQPLVWTSSKFKIRNPTDGHSVEVELPLPEHMREEGMARQLDFRGDGMWM